MGKTSKAFSLLFAAIFVISILMMVKPSDAQIISKPTVPEFTLTFVSATTPHNSFVQITIKNQAFTPYREEDGRYIDLYYNMSYKPHNETEWNYYVSNYYFVRQTSTNNTVIKQVPNADQMDFRVQAKIGYVTLISEKPVIIYELTGQTSDWSNVQTITILETSPSPTPTVPEFQVWTIPILITIMVTAVLLVCFKKPSRT